MSGESINAEHNVGIRRVVGYPRAPDDRHTRDRGMVNAWSTSSGKVEQLGTTIARQRPIPDRTGRLAGGHTRRLLAERATASSAGES